jgi:hypothetical protein
MSPVQVGRIIVLVGMLSVMVGLLVWSGALNWFGRLPGDIRVERGDTRVFVPWVSLLVVSALFNLAMWAARRFLW